MAKASLTLPNGTVVEIEGTVAEVRDLLQFYGGSAGSKAERREVAVSRRSQKTDRSRTTRKKQSSSDTPKSELDLSKIISLAKTCDEAENLSNP
jgi:hypothetical protein